MAHVLREAHAFGVEPVPPRHRVLGLWDSGVLWADLGISFLVMVVGTFLVPGLGLGTALLAIVVGAVIGNVLLGLAATVGSDTGVPTMVLLRAPLGVRGSYAPTVVNILQLLGWAAFEVIVMAQAANTLAMRLFDAPSAYHAWVVVFTLLTLALALAGPVLVTKQVLEKVVVWAVLATTVWMTVALLTTYDIGELWSRPGTGGLTFWRAVDLVVALPISWFPLVADYSRFARDRRAAFWGTALGYAVPHIWFYALGALLALAAGVAFDPNAPITPLISAIAGLTAGGLALLVLLVDETDEGFANIYSTAVSIQNLLPRAGQRTLIVLISAVVLVIAWMVPLTRYEGFLLLIGAVFVPLLGVLAADYFVVRGRRYDVDELFRTEGAYWYRGGVNAVAIGVWLAGAALYITIAGLAGFGVKGVSGWLADGLAPELGASLPSFVAAFLLHLALSRLAGQRAAPQVARGT